MDIKPSIPNFDDRVRIANTLFNCHGTVDECAVVWFQREAAFWHAFYGELDSRPKYDEEKGRYYPRSPIDHFIIAQELSAYYAEKAVSSLCNLVDYVEYVRQYSNTESHMEFIDENYYFVAP